MDIAKYRNGWWWWRVDGVLVAGQLLTVGIGCGGVHHEVGRVVRTVMSSQWPVERIRDTSRSIDISVLSQIWCVG